ncbi:MAG: biotin--[acetyl-CoA-carboxylase] ligase, partial [Gaiellales bacterium]
MATDTLEPDVVLPMLRSAFGRPYRYTECCPSTQDLLRADDPQGTVAVADEQLAGRGRLGRRWTAPPGAAILCSVVLRPPPGRVAAQTSLVGGIAAARTLS